MDFDEIQRILAMVKEHELAEFELEHQGFKIRIRKDSPHPPVVAMAAPGLVAQVPVAASPAHAAAPSAAPAPDDGELEFAIVKSPIVGTFYRASEPGARAFADVGDIVKKGQVLCIIEAMKLMNEIESDTDGEVTAAYVENGRPVQFGDRLFAIKIAGR
jgi:acetyl-CoA carboxylase biotin carboxyl carrier protein